jgi:hypothetical protein
MRWTDLVRRSLTYYWRTNIAVVAGIATAVAVLAGALLVGDSVRGSLRDLVAERLGRTDHVVLSAEFFREELADGLKSSESFNASFSGAAPLIALPGFASDPASGRRVGQVRIYGVDERFWQLHDLRPRELEPGDALVSRALASELDAATGSVVLVRLQLPSEIPLESLQGRKESTGTTLRVTVSDIVPAPDLGDFSLDAQQGEVRAVFVPLSFIQRELSIRGRVNTILVSVKPDAVLESGTVMLEEHLRRLSTRSDSR